jgi:phosphoenolpyruvate synthase/pyruvate phosphate dikinase
MARSEAEPYIINLKARSVPDTIGNKARNLRALMRKEVRVPQTYVIRWEAYDRYARDDVAVVEIVQEEVKHLLEPNKSYAVRSSASIEDTQERSFAGQFKTVLDARSEQSILQAVWSIWATANSPGVQAYLEKLPAQDHKLHMAVIIQEMVEPLVSGVAFSRNPLTGEDQVIVEAVKGAGTALVQDGVTPLHWISQRGNWVTRPQEATVDEALIRIVVAETQRIAGVFKVDVDLEWVYNGQDLYWVQMRKITSDKTLTIYSNRIAKEVLPGMIKPLVWSVNVPLINSVWVRVLTELVGKNDLQIDDLAKSFYYRTYFNLSALGRIWKLLGMPQESLEMMMGILPRQPGQRIFKLTGRMIRLIPRLLVFISKKLRLGRRFEREYPLLVKQLHDINFSQAQNLSVEELVTAIDRLYANLQPLVYYNINIPVLMAVFNTLFERMLRNRGVDPARFDVMGDLSEHLKYDPEVDLQNLRSEYQSLHPAVQQDLQRCTYDEFRHLPGIADFQDKVAVFLQRFGHLSDSGNDFTAVPWRENPDLVLRLIAQELQLDAPPTKKIRLADIEKQINPLTRGWMRSVYHQARRYRLHREEISHLYTYAYGLLRPYFLALGQHFSAQGILADPTDIFYLSWAEVREAASSLTTRSAKNIHELCRERRVDMNRYRDIILPALIYGDVAPILSKEVKQKLIGVPTSSGYYSGPVKVVHGLEDFKKVQSGDVLVIPYSDVSWTPLFARAGAVVAESGGMLSHSSIVAREYRIPAVVSVPEAMQLRDHTQVTVDGYRGEVILHQDDNLI